MNVNRLTPNPVNNPTKFSLRIKTPEKLVVLSYDDMKKKLVTDGILDYDTIIVDDRIRSVCIYEKDGVRFVLKLGSHEVRGDTTKMKLLRNEDKVYNAIQTLAVAEQKYFPRVFDSGSVDDKFYYIIMEFVNGITLYDYINKVYTTQTPRPKKEVLRILVNLTKALGTLYTLGLMHGDLSVENVIITPDFNVKLIDFEKSSADIKLETNTYGTTGLDIDEKQTEGVGYYFLLVKTLSVAENSSQFTGLLRELKNKIDSCAFSKCKNIYSDCLDLLNRANGGKRKSRKTVRSKRVTRKCLVK